MARYYYSTQPFLAWCLNHYFYNQTHYVWVAAPFYPYRLNNPPSSNPFRIYQQFYEAWKHNDPHDKFIQQWRKDLQRGVLANKTHQNLSIVKRLKTICRRTPTVFFYPIVYRINLDIINSSRLVIDGSGKEVESQEYLITALQEVEFDLLFNDFAVEIHLSMAFDTLYALYQNQSSLTPNQVLKMIEDTWNDKT